MQPVHPCEGSAEAKRLPACRAAAKTSAELKLVGLELAQVPCGRMRLRAHARGRLRPRCAGPLLLQLRTAVCCTPAPRRERSKTNFCWGIESGARRRRAGGRAVVGRARAHGVCGRRNGRTTTTTTATRSKVRGAATRSAIWPQSERSCQGGLTEGDLMNRVTVKLRAKAERPSFRRRLPLRPLTWARFGLRHSTLVRFLKTARTFAGRTLDCIEPFSVH